MFTGLIAEVGSVAAIERSEVGATLRISSSLAAATGDSIAVDGVCLTVKSLATESFETKAMNQTLALTSIGGLREGRRVNLELAVRAGDRLGGHIVQGHVDGVGEIVAIEADGFAKRIKIELPEPLRRYTVEHGSIALNGVSLTVASLADTGVEVSLIPETLERTTFEQASLGDPVNVEVDLIARYAERLLQGFNQGGEQK